jgi:hypothetical protein
MLRGLDRISPAHPFLLQVLLGSLNLRLHLDLECFRFPVGFLHILLIDAGLLILLVDGNLALEDL